MKKTKLCFEQRLRALPLICALLLLGACSPSGIGEKTGSPRDALPAHITELTKLGVGVRPAWSRDGSRFLYLDALVGDVYEYDLASGSSQPLTAHFGHHGFTRAHYLANGDLLLCGPSEVDPDDPHQGRWDTDFWYLSRSLEKPAVSLGETCFEGPAVAITSMHFAWTRTNYPEVSPLTAKSEL